MNEKKVVFLAVNSKYIHTLLSVRYLVKYVANASVYETNINMAMSIVLDDLYALKPDVLAVSCYIFNIDYVKKLICDARILLPNTKIIVGGYEAENAGGDVIIYGEGENIILEAINGDKNVYYGSPIARLDDIISPYDDEYILQGKNKILYYESSRGCPFSCSYCMSANSDVRYFSLERVKLDLTKICSSAPKQVKFVDRTFNANMARATEIFRFIIDNFSDTDTNFHFELAPELFCEDMFSVLQKAKKGLIQFEIGVQSFNELALGAVNRKMKANLLEENVSRIIAMGNIHVHTDLIAGLPYEDKASFKKSYNRLYALKSSMLQLGFLKLLVGSDLRARSSEFGYRYFSSAPYEIVCSNWLSYEDIIELKTVERALDRYYNSGKFSLSLEYIMQFYDSAYDFYLQFGKFLESRRAFMELVSAQRSCDYLFEFAKNKCDESRLIALINADYKASGNTRSWKR